MINKLLKLLYMLDTTKSIVILIKRVNKYKLIVIHLVTFLPLFLEV